MKIGLDYHGVVDTNVRFFKTFARLLINDGNEVHLITGTSRKDYDSFDFEKKVSFTHFYSITDSLINLKVDYTIDKHGRPIFSNALWYNSKAHYCKDNKIDIMIDDTEMYSKFFTTPFVLWKRNK